MAFSYQQSMSRCQRSNTLQGAKTIGACELFQTLFSQPSIKEKSDLATQQFMYTIHATHVYAE